MGNTITRSERTARAHMLLTILATFPAFVFDIAGYCLDGEYHLHPLLVEQLLYRRGQFDGSLSIRENIERHYGREAADLAESLI